MTERFAGRQPENTPQQLVPLADLESASNGRFIWGVPLPTYLDSTVGIDLEQLVKHCDFVNLQRVAILPMRHESEEEPFMVTSINSDGSATGAVVADSTPPVFRTDLTRDPSVAQKPNAQPLARADAVIRIDTEAIAQNLARNKSAEVPSLKSGAMWAAKLDSIVKKSLGQLGKENVAQITAPRQFTFLFTAMTPYIAATGIIGTYLQHEPLIYTLQPLALYIAAINFYALSRSREFGNGYWRPTVFMGNQHDRALLHEIKLKTSHAIVRAS